MAYRTLVVDHTAEARLIKRRAMFAAILALLLLFTLLVRMFWLQVVEYSHFSDLSENNRVRLMAVPPKRGLIYDRNGVLLAENRPTFHLEIVPEQVGNVTETVAELSKIVSLNDEDFKRFWSSFKSHRAFESISLRTRLNDEEVARLAVNRHRFPGVDIKARLSRYYPQGESAVHAVGYVGRINEKELQTIDAGNYRGSTHIGKIGLEKFYEGVLHGKVGKQNVEVNAEGRTLKVVSEVAPVSGNDLILSLDMQLQKIAENELGDLSGAVIAMSTETGEVLVFASKPMYDPNLFVHGISFKAYDELRQAEEKPLFNRALFGQYPPGSTFKPFVGLAGLDSSIFSHKHDVLCKGYFLIPDDDEERRYRDWKRDGHGMVDFGHAMEQSCDVYFYEMSYLMGIDRMFNYLNRFGFGSKTGVDLVGERKGLLASKEWKRRVHNTKWFPGETLIAGIGQGYMLATPLQLAAATTAMANKGKLFKPHLVREIRTTNGEVVRTIVPEVNEIKIKHSYNWDIVHRSMRKVLHGSLGTARRVGERLTYTMAGKTGTAQVFGIAQGKRYDASKVKKKLRDHALFIAFAPYKNPKIAVAVVAENGEHGSYVAPIAKNIINKYLGKEDKPLSKPEPNSLDESEVPVLEE